MKRLTPIKAIRAKCLDCCCDSVSEVRLCELTNCTLHPYRMGKNPNINRESQKGQIPAGFLPRTGE